MSEQDLVRAPSPSGLADGKKVKPWRLWAVTVDNHSPELFGGRTAAAARYDAWLRYSDVWNCSFRRFLSISKVRSASTPADDGYGYVRRNYGVDPQIGARYELVNEGASSGKQGVCVYPGRSTAHVHLVIDGRDFVSTVHPFSVRLVAPDRSDEPLKAAHGTAREPTPNQQTPAPAASAAGAGKEISRD